MVYHLRIIIDHDINHYPSDSNVGGLGMRVHGNRDYAESKMVCRDTNLSRIRLVKTIIRTSQKQINNLQPLQSPLYNSYHIVANTYSPHRVSTSTTPSHTPLSPPHSSVQQVVGAGKHSGYQRMQFLDSRLLIRFHRRGH